MLLLLAAPVGVASAPVNVAGRELFTPPTVRQISITIPEEGLMVLRTNSRTYVAAAVREGTNAFERVAIHLKGSTGSFRKIDDKPGLTLDFDKYTPKQRFHGLSKIHLNNSVEDPSYLHEFIGSDAFHRAGIPAARVTHAVVDLNGRKLGLYVLKEGFTQEFLALHFLHPTGNLYEPGPSGRDVDESMNQQLGAVNEAGRDLEALAAAAEEPLGTRWQTLKRNLDVDRFITFMAMEMLTGHRDGYCLARNNFRVYHDVDSGRMMFFPHGMDQLFGYAKLPILPRMNGLVARSLMDLPEGRQQYRDRCGALLTNVLALSNVLARIDSALPVLENAVEPAARAPLLREIAALKERVSQRLDSVAQQLRQAPLELLAFHNSVATLPNWQPMDIPPAGELVRTNSPEGKAVLAIRAGPVTFGSWRSKVVLPPGQYRFDGKLRTLDVAPLGFGKNQGAALRVANAGVPKVSRWTGTEPWRAATVSFELAQQQEVDLICELRASRGQAWFELDSLRLIRLK
jgi:spore coat protein H